MKEWLLVPPIAFIIILSVSWLLSFLFSRLSFKPGKHSLGECKSYACGEENYNHMAHPDYSNFFPFAFFFTLAHVATLIMTTDPVATLGTLVMAALYIIGAALGLYILFRS
jgi:NADH-quinone oxidoreductase subunit A